MRVGTPRAEASVGVDQADRQLALRAAVAGLSVAVGSVPVLLLLLWVETKWGPLLRLDDSARDGLHRYALAHSAFTSVMEAVSAVAGGLGCADSWPSIARRSGIGVAATTMRRCGRGSARLPRRSGGMAVPGSISGYGERAGT